jgi:two-component system CheB/CheR fusion protein
MQNLLNSIEIATLFLDKEMNIRRFTDHLVTLMKIRNSDIGRPFTDIATDLQYPEMLNHARQVLKTLTPSESHISTTDGRWFRVRIIPYRTLDDRIDGLVITFIDITKTKNLESELAIVNSEEKAKRVAELIIANKEIIFQNNEKEGLEAELNKAIEILKENNLYKP